MRDSLAIQTASGIWKKQNNTECGKVMKNKQITKYKKPNLKTSKKSQKKGRQAISIHLYHRYNWFFVSVRPHDSTN